MLSIHASGLIIKCLIKTHNTIQYSTTSTGPFSKQWKTPIFNVIHRVAHKVQQICFCFVISFPLSPDCVFFFLFFFDDAKCSESLQNYAAEYDVQLHQTATTTTTKMRLLRAYNGKECISPALYNQRAKVHTVKNSTVTVKLRALNKINQYIFIYSQGKKKINTKQSKQMKKRKEKNHHNKRKTRNKAQFLFPSAHLRNCLVFIFVSRVQKRRPQQRKKKRQLSV